MSCDENAIDVVVLITVTNYPYNVAADVPYTCVYIWEAIHLCSHRVIESLTYSCRSVGQLSTVDHGLRIVDHYSTKPNGHQYPQEDEDENCDHYLQLRKGGGGERG